MRIISIKVNKKEIYYAVMSKQDSENIILEKDEKISIPQNKTQPQLMGFFKDSFVNLLSEVKIKRVVYWCDSPGKALLLMPLGVLNLCCNECNIDTKSKYSQNITAGLLGFETKERGKKAIALMKDFYKNAKYKNEDMRKVLAIGTVVLRGGN